MLVLYCAASAGCPASHPVVAQTPSPGSGQSFPSKPIRIIATYPPASVADVLARPIAQRTYVTRGQPVIVDNRNGAGGNVDANVVAKSAPDGYTLLLGTLAPMPSTRRCTRKCPTAHNFAPTTQAAYAHLLPVVHPSVPLKTMKNPIALVKPTGATAS